MICWADITLPSSRVRWDALRTNLLNSALLGRRVTGIVSGSFGLVFCGFERAGAGATTAPWQQALKTLTLARALNSFPPTGWLRRNAGG